jgi:hypothetical protein
MLAVADAADPKARTSDGNPRRSPPALPRGCQPPAERSAGRSADAAALAGRTSASHVPLATGTERFLAPTKAFVARTRSPSPPRAPAPAAAPVVKHSGSAHAAPPVQMHPHLGLAARARALQERRTAEARRNSGAVGADHGGELAPRLRRRPEGGVPQACDEICSTVEYWALADAAPDNESSTSADEEPHGWLRQVGNFAVVRRSSGGDCTPWERHPPAGVAEACGPPAHSGWRAADDNNSLRGMLQPAKAAGPGRAAPRSGDRQRVAQVPACMRGGRHLALLVHSSPRAALRSLSSSRRELRQSIQAAERALARDDAAHSPDVDNNAALGGLMSAAPASAHHAHASACAPASSESVHRREQNPNDRAAGDLAPGQRLGQVGGWHASQQLGRVAFRRALADAARLANEAEL